MPAADFYEGMAYEMMEPFGDRRADLLAAIIACTIANVNRGPKTKPFKPADFIPRWDQVLERKQESEYSPEQERKIMMIFATVHNAKLKARQG